MEAVIRFDVDQASRLGCWVLFVVIIYAVVATDVGGRVRQLKNSRSWRLFLTLLGLFGGLGYLATGSVLEVHRLDNTDSDGLSHIIKLAF